MSRPRRPRDHHRERNAAGRMIGTRECVGAWTNRHRDVVKRYCEPIACDVATKLALYDLDEAAEILRPLRRAA